MLSRFQSGREFVSCTIKDIYLVRNLEHLRGVRLMFEKKNSKKLFVKKKRKERKKDECVFLLLFSPSQKKICFIHTKHTDIKYQIPHHHSFVARERKHTHIYIFIIIIFK